MVTNKDTVSSIKRKMGTNEKVEIDDKKYTPEEISAKILMKLKSDAEAYFICEVKSLKTTLREDDIKSSDVNYIKSEVVELNIKNKCVKPINRAIHALIEALVNYSRINIVDDDTQKYFLERFLESERVIKRVGNEEEKESSLILKEDLINQGFEI